MKNPSGEQAIQIIDDLVNKTLNTQDAFDRAIEKLHEEAARIRANVDDLAMPLSQHQTKLLLLNVSYIIRELGAVEKGFGKPILKTPRPEMPFEIETGTIKQ